MNGMSADCPIPPKSPVIPPIARLWRSVSLWIGLGYAWLVLAAVPPLVVSYWFLDGVGHSQVFWTNLATQSVLFAAGVALFGLAVAIPIRTYAVSPTLRRAAIHVGAWTGIFAGWLLALHYQDYLLAFHGGAFGQADPMFGADFGFYVFLLPALSKTRIALLWLAFVAAGASVAGRLDWLTSDHRPEPVTLTLWNKLGLFATNGLNAALFLLGLSLVAGTFLSRYELLFKDNSASGVRTGAAYLDVTGLFSTLNMIYVSTIVEFGMMAVVGYSLYRVGRHSEALIVPRSQDQAVEPLRLRTPLRIGIAFLAFDLAFFAAVVARDHLYVTPNEPTVQMPFIERHIEATLRGYRLDGVETVEWRPPEEPLAPERLLASRTVANAPLLPTWVSRLEEPPDIQHYERIQASESTLVYGPTLQIFEQEQQLRPYYRFVSVDGVRYEVDGEKRMYASSVRELPSLGFSGPKQWLQHWGSAALMYTHGFGLVMSPVNEINEEGGPRYALAGVPPKATAAAFDAEPRVYFGEGAKDGYILTNVRRLKEFDYATAQFRREAVHRPDVERGIAVDSLVKRLLLGLHSGDINEFLFSGFIDPSSTRAHLFRTPVQRISAIAPFLFLDTNVYAFIADGRIVWMINGLTSTDNYPYAFREVLGDKADERAVEPLPERVVNYAEDAVKITIDAYSGDVRFYKIADDPIVNPWERIYLDLFEPISSMPRDVRSQMTYPLQWFHIQFDDIYKRYHQRKPIGVYNAEDLSDDADEVVGSIGRGLTEFVHDRPDDGLFRGLQPLAGPDRPA